MRNHKNNGKYTKNKHNAEWYVKSRAHRLVRGY